MSAWLGRKALIRDNRQTDSLVFLLIVYYVTLFCSNTDKMSDAEKLPIALAGIAFITLPFIAGLIALYAAK